jgi:hypothetical protein
VIVVLLDLEGRVGFPGNFVDDGWGLGDVGLGVAAATLIGPPDTTRVASRPARSGYRVRVRRDAGGVVIL